MAPPLRKDWYKWISSQGASLVKRNFCTWRIKMYSNIKRKGKCDEVCCYCVCLSVCPRLWCWAACGLHDLCEFRLLGSTNAVTALFCFFFSFFAVMVIHFITACSLTKEKSPELPLISCSIAPLGQNAWANSIPREFNTPLLLWNWTLRRVDSAP